jgi:antitoxin VapB
MAQANRNPDVREARLFRNNKSQAVRIPVDMELPGDRVMIHREGNRLVLEPVKKGGLLEYLAGLEPLGPEDAFPDDIDSDLLPLDPVDL